jgi:4-carboxymuconolactone decarboxylase
MSEGPVRFQEIAPETYSQSQKDVLAKVAAGRGRVPTPFKVWLHSPKLAHAIEHLGTMLNMQSSLSEREFELAIVLIGQHWESPYVIDAHIKFLRKTGMPETVLTDLAARRPPTFETEREKAIYAVYQAFDRKEVASDLVFDQAVKVLGRDGLAELLAFLGYYTAVAMAMKIHRMPVPPLEA